MANKLHDFVNASTMKVLYDSSSLETSEPRQKFMPCNQVPLLKCGIIVENAPGTCYVTANEMVFITYVGFLSGEALSMITLSDVDIVSFDNKNTTLFDGSDKVISVRTKEKKEIFSFVPSIGVEPFRNFIETIRTIDEENENH